jgi:hypothetical protein
MHSAALLRNWSKLGKSASISIHMGTDRAFCPKNDCQIKLGQFAANWQFYKRVRRSGWIFARVTGREAEVNR